MARYALQDERGAVLLVIVLSLVTFFALVMLVVDVGGLLSTHRRVVRAVDAASLAAAQTCARQLPEDPTSVAGEYAQENVEDAVLTQVDISGCDDPSGRVTVTLQAPQSLFFAPIFGWEDFMNVPARSTAVWGPAGSATSIPLAADEEKLDACGIPGSEEECHLWYLHGDPAGSTVDWLNLSEWDTAPGVNCPDPGAGDMESWLMDGFPTPPLNWPDPTYVCAADVGDQSEDLWRVVGDMIAAGPAPGPMRILPVNDPGGSTADKYDVVGFVALRLIAVYDGDDPGAIGTPEVPGTPDAGGHCKHEKASFSHNESVTLDFIPGAGCPNNQTPDTVTPDDPFVYDDTDDEITPYTGCPGPVPGPGCNYIWDAAAHQITWVDPDGAEDVWIEFDWFKAGDPPIDGTEGACGVNGLGPGGVPGTAEDKCLVVLWPGFLSEGSNPDGGADFGLHPVRLCDPRHDSICP